MERRLEEIYLFMYTTELTVNIESWCVLSELDLFRMATAQEAEYELYLKRKEEYVSGHVAWFQYFLRSDIAKIDTVALLCWT